MGSRNSSSVARTLWLGAAMVDSSRPGPAPQPPSRGKQPRPDIAKAYAVSTQPWWIVGVQCTMTLRQLVETLGSCSGWWTSGSPSLGLGSQSIGRRPDVHPFGERSDGARSAARQLMNGLSVTGACVEDRAALSLASC